MKSTKSICLLLGVIIIIININYACAQWNAGPSTYNPYAIRACSDRHNQTKCLRVSHSKSSSYVCAWWSLAFMSCVFIVVRCK